MVFLFSIPGHWEEEYQGVTGVVAAAVSIQGFGVARVVVLLGTWRASAYRHS